MSGPLVFPVATPFGLVVYCTDRQWERISCLKHPVLRDRLQEVIRGLMFPEHVRRSRTERRVLLFYRRHEKRWLCAVIRIDPDGAFVVTAYPTDNLKAGEIVWTTFG
jgi:hypothetical protein